MAAKWELKCPFMVEWRNGLRCSHSSEFYTAVRMNQPSSEKQARHTGADYGFFSHKVQRHQNRSTVLEVNYPFPLFLPSLFTVSVCILITVSI